MAAGHAREQACLGVLGASFVPVGYLFMQFCPRPPGRFNKGSASQRRRRGQPGPPRPRQAQTHPAKPTPAQPQTHPPCPMPHPRAPSRPRPAPPAPRPSSSHSHPTNAAATPLKCRGLALKCRGLALEMSRPQAASTAPAEPDRDGHGPRHFKGMAAAFEGKSAAFQGRGRGICRPNLENQRKERRGRRRL